MRDDFFVGTGHALSLQTAQFEYHHKTKNHSNLAAGMVMRIVVLVSFTP